MATFLDIFAGIGGMRRGLESAGHRCVGYIEWDKYARKSYEAIFETKGEWTASDVTTVRASDLPRADIWTFGFPCQDLSVAGRQLGFNGNRSSLFFTVVDLLRNTEERNRPEWLIAENVMGFFSSNRGYDFLAAQVALDEIGYDVEWEVFNATQFGIPQNRQRVFLVGHSRRHGRREVFPVRREGSQAVEPPVEFSVNGSGISYNIDANYWKGTSVGNIGKGRRTHVVVYQRPRGNNSGGFHGVAPSVTVRSYQDNNLLVDDVSIRKFTALETWRLMGRTDDDFHEAKNAGVSDTQLYKQAGNSLIPQIVQAIGERIAELSVSTVEAVATT